MDRILVARMIALVKYDLFKMLTVYLISCKPYNLLKTLYFHIIFLLKSEIADIILASYNTFDCLNIVYLV